MQACLLLFGFTFIHIGSHAHAVQEESCFREICFLEVLAVAFSAQQPLQLRAVFLSLVMVVSLSTCSPQRRVVFASVLIKDGTPTKAAICTGFHITPTCMCTRFRAKQALMPYFIILSSSSVVLAFLHVQHSLSYYLSFSVLYL